MFFFFCYFLTEGSSVESNNKKADKEKRICASESSRALRQTLTPPSIVLGMKQTEPAMFKDEENTDPNKKLNDVKRGESVWSGLHS